MCDRGFATLIVSLSLFGLAPGTTLASAPQDTLSLTVTPLLVEPPSAPAATSVAVHAVRSSEDRIEDLGNSEYRVTPAREHALWNILVIGVTSPPGGYRAHVFRLRVPYHEHAVVAYGLATNTVPGESDEVQKLNEVDPNDLSGENLFTYYARARTQFEFYKSGHSDRWEAILAAFSYLQSSKQLALKNYLEAYSEISAAREWLAIAIREHKAAVNNSVGLVRARQLVQQTENVEGAVYVTLWHKIESRHRSDETLYCAYVGELQQDIEGQVEERRERLYQSDSLGPIVVLAYADCLGRRYRKGDVSRDLSAEIVDQIRILEERKGALAQGDVKTATDCENRIIELLEIKNALGQDQHVVGSAG